MAVKLKQIKLAQMKKSLTQQLKNGPNADGTMTKEQRNEYVETFRKELVSAEKEALMQRGRDTGLRPRPGQIQRSCTARPTNGCRSPKRKNWSELAELFCRR